MNWPFISYLRTIQIESMSNSYFLRIFFKSHNIIIIKRILDAFIFVNLFKNTLKIVTTADQVPLSAIR